MPVWIVEIEGDCRAPHDGAGRSVDSNHVPSVGMAQRQELAEEPRREAPHARADDVDANPLEVPETDFNRGDSKVVERPILEARLAWRKNVPETLDGREVDGAAREPWPQQHRPGIVPHQEAADARRIAEHLVEGY